MRNRTDSRWRPWLIAVAAVGLTFAAGCPDGGGGGTQPAQDTSVDVDTGGVDTTDAGEGDSDTTDTFACTDAPECDPDERLVGCSRCVNKMNRVCESDRDCRPEETCKKVDGTRVCIYEPGPARTCPGSKGCSDGSGPLKAAAASRVVTPKGFERPKPAGVDDDNYMNFQASKAPDDKWHDCGWDGLCPGDKGYDKPDEGEDDGIPQGMWLAGFSHGRPAQYCPEMKIGCPEVDCCVSKYAHDNLKVQITVLQQGGTTVAFASLDAIGWFHSDIERIRERLPDDLGVDLLVMSGTHVHEAPDTAGQWGPGKQLPQRTGRHPKFIEKIYTQTVDGITAAVGDLKEARAEVHVVDAGIEGMAMSDSRPPYIFDDNIPVVRLLEKSSDKSIATMISVPNHAEALWSENPYITSDYPHYVRKYVREGLGPVKDNSGNVVEPKLEGFGGVTVFFPGAIGGLINPGDGGALDYAGEAPAETHSFEAASAIGEQVASRVLQAYDDGKFEAISDPQLAFAHKEFLTPIRNRRFQLAAFVQELLKRDVYNVVREGFGQYEPGHPMLLSEVNVVRLGDATFFTAPGEAFPESLVGGFPGKSTAQDPVVGDVHEYETPAKCDKEGLPVQNGSGSNPCIVEPGQKNPPDWSKAPGPPYVYEKVPGDHPFFIGLGGDFLGYIVPKYDYEIEDFTREAPGSHYEETNGVGPEIVGKWKKNLQRAVDALSK